MEDARMNQDTTSLEEILQEASALLQEPEAPPAAPAAPSRQRSRHNDRVIIGLLITACLLCLGIIGILAYWLRFLG